MPLPLVAIPWIIGALGGGLLTAWAMDSNDVWDDAEVFNSRMLEIHTGILQLNRLFSTCQAFKDRPDTVIAWKQFIVLWTTYFRNVGNVWFSPSDAEIAEAKRFAQKLALYIDTYKNMCGEIPTGMMPIADPDQPRPPMTWQGVALGIGISIAATIAAAIAIRSALKSPHS